MKSHSLSELKSRLHITPSSEEEANILIQSISLDSRHVTPSTLFIALKGERVDSHRFVKDLIESRACAAALVEEPLSVQADLQHRLIQVPNTLDAFRELMHQDLLQHPARRLVVAGSVGKTSSKEMLRALLKGRFTHILATEGSENGFIGIPKTLTKLNDTTEVILLEVGIDEPGAMQAHLKLIEPHAGLLTAIGPEHLEKLGTLERVSEEERELFRVLKHSHGVRIVNLDDPLLASEMDTEDALVWGFTLDPARRFASERILLGQISESTGLLDVFHADHLFGSFKCPLPGIHQARNLLGAITLLKAVFDFSAEETASGLSFFQGAKGRTEVHPSSTTKATWFLDHYNASPESMQAALQTLTQLAQNARIHLVLGDMLELGGNELDFHRALAPAIQALPNRASVLLYGPRMKALAQALGTTPHLHTETSHEALASELRAQLQPGDWILLKGSRGMKMERIFELIEGKAP